MFLEILQNSQENTCARVSFLKDSDTGVFLWTLRNFYEHTFYKTPLGHCFWSFVIAVSVRYKRDLVNQRISHKVLYKLFIVTLREQGNKFFVDCGFGLNCKTRTLFWTQSNIYDEGADTGVFLWILQNF